MKTQKCVAYARVSTNKNDQANSLENQTTYFQRELEHNKNYSMLKHNIDGLCNNGVYYDKGVSGTKISRPAFDRMLEDAGLTAVIDADTDKKTTSYKIVRKPKFNYIFVKDTSRFARNVSINPLLRTLKENNVYVNFLDISKSTVNDEDFVVIQLFLSLAERESTDKSKKVSFGYEEGVRQGKLYFGGKMIGYDYDKENNSLVINEEEAKLVRRVFDLYTVEEIGQQRICNQLFEEGYLNSKGNCYTRSTIKRMLQNEKYCGITNCGRYKKVDLFSDKRIQLDYNDPLRVQARKSQQEQLEQGIVKIPPIISVEQFKKAQEINERNSKLYHIDGSWHGTTDYAKKVVCGQCGAYYRAQGRKYYAKYNDKISVYTCKNRVDQPKEHRCCNPSIKEPELDKALNSKQYYINRLENIEELQYKGQGYLDILTSALNQDNADKVSQIETEIKDIEEQRTRLIKLYTKGTFDESQLDTMNAEYTDKISKLKSQKEMLESGNNEIYKQIDYLNSLMQEADKEYTNTKRILETGEYPKKTRKELLRDVEKIVIDIDGNPNIVFKSVQVIDEFISNMDIKLQVYQNTEDNVIKKDLETVIQSVKDKGFIVKTGENA